MAKRRYTPRGRRVFRQHKINQEIQSREVRVVGVEDGDNSGLMTLTEALQLGEEMGVDVVQISDKNDPPIVKLIEYSKFKYELSKKKKEAKSKQHIAQLKEIRFGPNTDDHDFNFKLKHATKFLEEGHKVRAYVQFRGRNIVYKDRGAKVLLRMAQALEDVAKVEIMPKMEGRRMHIILSPKAKKGKK